MTRKDYVKIAAVLAESRQIFELAEPDQLDSIIENFASMLSADNPNFDRARFYKACGMEAENNGN